MVTRYADDQNTIRGIPHTPLDPWNADRCNLGAIARGSPHQQTPVDNNSPLLSGVASSVATLRNPCARVVRTNPRTRSSNKHPSTGSSPLLSGVACHPKKSDGLIRTVRCATCKSRCAHLKTMPMGPAVQPPRRCYTRYAEYRIARGTRYGYGAETLYAAGSTSSTH